MAYQLFSWLAFNQCPRRVNYPYSTFLGLDGSMDGEDEGSMADRPGKVNPRVYIR